jgi:predicted XRE-type DNA-binding protein
MSKRSSSVWNALEGTPGEPENMKLRSKLMIILKDHIKAQGWTQAEAAKRMNVTQPRISDLMRGKVDLFGLDSLVTMLRAAGLRLEFRVKQTR